MSKASELHIGDVVDLGVVTPFRITRFVDLLDIVELAGYAGINDSERVRVTVPANAEVSVWE